MENINHCSDRHRLDIICIVDCSFIRIHQYIHINTDGHLLLLFKHTVHHTTCHRSNPLIYNAVQDVFLHNFNIKIIRITILIIIWPLKLLNSLQMLRMMVAVAAVVPSPDKYVNVVMATATCKMWRYKLSNHVVDT